MKKLFALTTLAAAALLAGCATASYNQPLVLASVGPSPQAAASRDGKTGALLVYSAMDTAADNDGDPFNKYAHYYSDYELWSADGAHLLQKIDNRAQPYTTTAPTNVDLKPGHYLVKALSNSYGWVNVPVVIAARQTTKVHLAGGDYKIDKTRSSPGTVYLPDGEVVGIRAN